MIEVKHIETKENGKLVKETFEIKYIFKTIELDKKEAQELLQKLGEKLK